MTHDASDPAAPERPSGVALDEAAAGLRPPPRLRLRLCYSDGAMLGPGKADLLEGIAESGSIAAAGRQMGMSYKRAWSLVETMNAAFHEPLVLRSRGGPQGGGAVLTDTGQRVLAHYRRVQARAAEATTEDIAAITALMRPVATPE